MRKKKVFFFFVNRNKEESAISLKKFDRHHSEKTFKKRHHDRLQNVHYKQPSPITISAHHIPKEFDFQGRLSSQILIDFQNNVDFEKHVSPYMYCQSLYAQVFQICNLKNHLKTN